MSAEKKILFCLAMFLVLLEIATRIAEPRLSKDLEHILRLPEIAGALEKTKSDAGATDQPLDSVLVVGNSLARCGIDEDMFRQGLKRADGQSPSVAFFTPDGGGILEWSWGFRRYVLHQGARPDLVILVSGRGHLLQFEPSRRQLSAMGAFFVDTRDRAKFLAEELGGVEARLNFVVDSHSRLSADRARVRPLLFYRTVPGYETAVNQVNVALGGGVKNSSAEEKEGIPLRPGGLDALRFLIQSVEETGARLLVVTAPLPDEYSLPDQAAKFLEQAGIPVLPLGKTMRLPAERFPDGYHLDEEGAARFTQAITEYIQAQ